MKHPLSWSTYACTALFLIGVFRSIYLYSVSTRDLRWSDEHPMVDDVDDDGYASSRPKAARPVAPQTEAGLSNVSSVLDDKAEGLFYFVQLSDLHLSKFQAKGHTIHFLHFLQSILPVIQPEFVVVTGDLIDGKDKTRTVSAQYVDEWKVYHTALKETVLSSDAYRRDGRPLPWYDMRGNHDCFDLDSWTADNNYYKEYGQSAKAWEEGQGVYRWEVNKPFGDYQFIAVDACPKRGPSRPFNFFGYLTTHTMDRLASLLLSNKKRYHHTFLFSHYPTTTMIPGISSNDVLKTYFRRTDSLELELSDMKDHGSYRIVAVDHDLISFVDLDLPITRIPAVPHDSIVPLSAPEETLVWPAEEERLDPAPMVLITHPKDARYLLPSKEPLRLSKQSSHLRFLVFSLYEASQLDTQIWIDGQRHPFPAHFVGQGPQQQQQTLPLWTSVWDSNDFDDRKTHHLRIVVTAPDGQRGEHDIPFRMDATREKIRGGAGEWMMWTHISLLVRMEPKGSLSIVVLLKLNPNVLYSSCASCVFLLFMLWCWFF
ncbi:Metallo-dependent phosphatase-like protein [Mycotypha africana]|uniref:Metallo-dependent phosphatase-like protein n=1 Tax=Mycotypha africana TaxID=64632 RepID=UPI002301D17E|nr:Metallo-dependent phosphatase-like protein [Mycotypha africana]KAI8991171.1 Metallo-dependent phosphatase-like protein [Mycotypha africana]